MAQIIKHRRGNLEGLKDATTRAGELLVVTGSSGLGTIANGDSLVFVGIDGSTATPVNKILQGTTVPNLSGTDYNTHVDGIPFFDTDNAKLYILNKGGNVEVTAAAAAGTVSGSSQIVLQDADKTGFTGASSITTLGTIATGVWNGTAIANANLANSSITIDGSAISLGGSVTTLQLGTSSSTALAGDTTTITGGQASAITANTAKVGYTDALVKAKLDTDGVSSGSASEIKSFLSISASDISDVDAFSQSGNYSGLRAQATTATDVGLGNVDNESKATMFSAAALTGNSTAVTQADNDNSTKIATTAYVQREVSDLLGGAPAAFDTLLEISASIANGDSDVVSLTTVVGGKLQKDQNLSDLTNASTARTNLGVDAAGTDNSTNVTLVTDSHDYLSISGQAITLAAITNDDLAGSIANGKLSNSSITIDGSAISLGGSVTTLQLGTSSSTALAGDTTTISGGQASAITANTAKTGITSGQASAITANTAKISFDSDSSTKLGTIEESADVTDATNVTAAGALMDSEVTDLAGIKGVTISTLQVKPSEGAFADGDKTKLDAIEASADVTDATNVAAAVLNQAIDFGSGRVSGEDFGDVAGTSTFTGSFVGSGAGLTGLASSLTVNTADVDLLTDDLDIVGTANEIDVATAKVGNDVTVTVGLPNDVSIGNNLTVGGNLTVEGTTTTIDSTTVNIGDRIIELNYARNAGDAGLLVSDVDGGGTTSGSLLWDASADHWMAGALGSEKEVARLNASPTSNTVLKADSNGLLVDSLITDDGTNVTVSGTAELRINAATANSFVYFDSNKSIESVAAATAGDVIQWNGSSFVASNELDGGTF
jgi:hypothetical protein